MSQLVFSSVQVELAAQALMRGELVAFPTETVYGLGADAASPDAVKRIYDAKGRPSSHPVIVHIASAAEMVPWCEVVPDVAWQLASRFWPGPLTLIMKRAPAVDSAVSGGQETVGIRCPAHPVAHELLEAFARLKHAAGLSLVGVAAPSANRFGRVSPTRAAHVRAEFTELANAGMPILEGGDSEVGIESTIVDLSSLEQGNRLAILRPGAISAQDIADATGLVVGLGHDASPRVSGSLRAHYAPDTFLRLVSADELTHQVHDWLGSHRGRLAVMGCLANRIQHDRLVWIPMPADARAYAHALYATLRRIDELGVESVLCESVPHQPDWAGVQDRLGRAAAAFES